MKLFITEFMSGQPSSSSHPRAILTSQAIEIGKDAVMSLPVQEDTTLVRVLADAPCTIAIGADPAVTKDGPIPLTPGIPEIFGVSKGRDRIAVIAR